MNNKKIKRAFNGVTLILVSTVVYRVLLIFRPILRDFPQLLNEETVQSGGSITGLLFTFGLPILYAVLVIVGLALFLQIVQDREGGNSIGCLFASYGIAVATLFTTSIPAILLYLLTMLFALIGFYYLSRSNSLDKKGRSGANLLFFYSAFTIGLYTMKAILFTPAIYDFLYSKGWSIMDSGRVLFYLANLALMVLEVIGWYRIRKSFREKLPRKAGPIIEYV